MCIWNADERNAVSLADNLKPTNRIVHDAEETRTLPERTCAAVSLINAFVKIDRLVDWPWADKEISSGRVRFDYFHPTYVFENTASFEKKRNRKRSIYKNFLSILQRYHAAFLKLIWLFDSSEFEGTIPRKRIFKFFNYLKKYILLDISFEFVTCWRSLTKKTFVKNKVFYKP